MPHIPIGTRCETSQGLYELLKDWFENSREWTISDGTNATKGYIVVTLGGLTCVMSGDTTRDGVTSPEAWKSYGLNIDGKVTGAGATDACTPVSGSPCDSSLDGNDGIGKTLQKTCGNQSIGRASGRLL